MGSIIFESGDPYTGEIWDAERTGYTRLDLVGHERPAAAMARALSATLITRDARLRDYAHVRTAWQCARVRAKVHAWLQSHEYSA